MQDVHDLPVYDPAIRPDRYQADARRHVRPVVPPQVEFGLHRCLLRSMQGLCRGDEVVSTAPKRDTPAFTDESGLVPAADFLAVLALAAGDRFAECRTGEWLSCRAPSAIGRNHERRHIFHPIVVSLC